MEVGFALQKLIKCQFTVDRKETQTHKFRNECIT